MNFYFYLAIAPICFASGNSLFKIWATTEKWWTLALGLLIFAVGNLFVTHAIKLTSLVGTTSIVPLATLALSLLAGFFYFGERLATIQYFGLAFAVVAITLLAFPFQIFSK